MPSVQHLQNKANPEPRLPRSKQRAHPSLRSGNVTWEKLQGPQAAAKYCHLELSNPAEQKFPDLNGAHPGMMNGRRQSSVCSSSLRPRSGPYLTPQSAPSQPQGSAWVPVGCPQKERQTAKPPLESPPPELRGHNNTAVNATKRRVSVWP